MRSLWWTGSVSVLLRQFFSRTPATSRTDRLDRLSNGWFHGFRERKLIACRVPTSQAQEMPEHYRDTAVCFLSFLRRNSMPRRGEIVKPGGVGRFHRRLVFNMDQMALPFSFDEPMPVAVRTR
jgi:hypothetical protein